MNTTTIQTNVRMNPTLTSTNINANSNNKTNTRTSENKTNAIIRTSDTSFVPLGQPTIS